MCERSPVEGLGTCSAPGRAGLVGESNGLCRARWLTFGVDSTDCIRVVDEILQALSEVGRRDERRREYEKEKNTSGNRMHVVWEGK